MGKEITMRSHKPHRGSYLNHIKLTQPLPLLKEAMSYRGSTEEQALYGLSYAYPDKNPKGYLDHVDGGHSPLMEIYSAINYIKRSPTDIVLDRSVKNYLESSPLKEEITIPPLDKGMVWVDLSSWNIKVNPDITGTSGSIEKVKGILLIETPEWWKKAMEYTPTSLIAQEKFSDRMPTYWCNVHATNKYLYAFPLDKTLSFGEFIAHEKRGDVSPQMGYAKAAAFGLTALEMIYEGQFVRDTKVFQDSRFPAGRKKIKTKGKSKGARFKQKYREFRTTYFRHVDSDPKTMETRKYTPPEHYTPRNVRSHYKERWVTLDYVEKHNVVDEDIIDLEDRTKSYKKGEATKTWFLIKLWYEFNQDPNLAPTQEIERYRV